MQISTEVSFEVAVRGDGGVAGEGKLLVNEGLSAPWMYTPNGCQFPPVAIHSSVQYFIRTAGIVSIYRQRHSSTRISTKVCL